MLGIMDAIAPGLAKSSSPTCAVIGSGPNGLAGAVRMAQAGYAVTVYEAQEQPGGGCVSLPLTLPGYIHDHCSAIHPLGIGSGYFRTLPLAEHGLEWIQPDAPLAHPLDDGTAAILHRSIAATAYTLNEDANTYTRLFTPIVPRDWSETADAMLHPVLAAKHPFGLARFGLPALLSARALAKRCFRGEHARALFAGCAAHSFLPLEESPSAAFGIALMVLGHAVGWPLPRGGSQKIADSLIGVLRTYGGEIVTGRKIEDVAELDGFDVVLADIGAKNLLQLAGNRLPSLYKSQLEAFQPGPGVFKMDYAIDGPIPWKAKECLLAGTVHLGGTFDEIAASEAAVTRGEHSSNPYILLAQQSLFDPTRAPSGKHTVWAYCHVPQYSNEDQSGTITRQIERFAPGFSSRIIAQRKTTPREFEARNATLPGGDISGGAYTLRQLFTRPAIQPNPWATGVPNLYLCSASTPPGGGVHGLCGYYAAQSALGQLLSL